jgi:lysophospholipid acyltransferase (LPLAT)-like uncharacterized protein
VRLRTWDRTIVPAPGSLVHVEERVPLQVPVAAADAPDTAAWNRRIAEALGAEERP